MAKERGFRAPGYTQIPDELFDELMPVLSGSEFKVLCYIARRTLGWQRVSDSISISQISEGITTRDGRKLDGGTGLARHTVIDAAASLEEQGWIVTRRQLDEGTSQHFPTVYSLNIQEGGSAKITPPPSPEIALPLVQKEHQGVVQKEHHIQKTVDTRDSLQETTTPLPPSSSTSSSKNEQHLTESPHVDFKGPHERMDIGSLHEQMLRMYRDAKGARRLKSDDQQRLKEWLDDTLGNQEPEEILAAWDYFLTDDHWREKGYPLTSWPKVFTTWASPYAHPARHAIAEARVVPDSPPPTAAAPSPGKGPIVPDPPPLWETWDKLVPSTPSKWNPKRHHLPPIEPELAENFEAICRKAEEFHRESPDVYFYVTFQWLLKEDPKDKTGRFNWEKFLAGDLDGMANKNNKSNQKKKIEDTVKQVRDMYRANQ